MKVTGKITAVLSEASGTSKSGKPWRKRDYIVTYDSSNPAYPKSILFSVMGDKIDQLNIQQYVDYELWLDFTTREYNGKYFLSASCWKAEPKAAMQPQPQPQAQPTLPPAPAQGDDTEQLPF